MGLGGGTVLFWSLAGGSSPSLIPCAQPVTYFFLPLCRLLTCRCDCRDRSSRVRSCGRRSAPRPRSSSAREMCSWERASGLPRLTRSKWLLRWTPTMTTHGAGWASLNTRTPESMRCLKLNPTDPVAHTNLASVLRYVRRGVDNAERMLRRALEIDPDYPNAHCKLSGLLLQERGDLDGSIKQMEEYNRCGGISGGIPVTMAKCSSQSLWRKRRRCMPRCAIILWP